MTREHLILCGGVEGRKATGALRAPPVPRPLWQRHAEESRTSVENCWPRSQTGLSISWKSRPMSTPPTGRFTVVEKRIANGEHSGVTRSVIPVRQPDLWNSKPMSSALVEVLGFLSDDQYAFEFECLGDPPSMAGYLEFASDSKSRFSPEEVILFSGDNSLAGPSRKRSRTARRSRSLVTTRRPRSPALRSILCMNCVIVPRAGYGMFRSWRR